MTDEPMIDLSSDDYFMGEALRQAMKAWEAEEVPIGAVIVHEGRIIARRDALPHRRRGGDRELAAHRLHAVRHQGAVSDVCRGNGALPT